MTQHCCVEDCKHNRRNSSCTFKRFPTDPQKSKLWESLIQQGQDWERTSWDRICECHFEDDQFERNRQDGLRKLRWDAVPSLFGSRAKVPPPLVKLKKGSVPSRSGEAGKKSQSKEENNITKSKEEGKGNNSVSNQRREPQTGSSIELSGDVSITKDDTREDKLSTEPESSNYMQHNLQQDVQQNIIVNIQQNIQEEVFQISEVEDSNNALQNEQIIVQDVGHNISHVVGQVLGRVVSLEDGNEVAEVVTMDEYDAEEVEVEIEDCSDEDIVSEGVVTTYQVQVIESGADESDEGVEGELGEGSPKQSVHHRTKRIVIKVPSSMASHQQNDIDPDSMAQALFKSPVHERNFAEELPVSNIDNQENLLQSSSITTEVEESEQESNDYQPPARASVEVQTMDITEEQLAEYGEQYSQIYEEQSEQGDQEEQIEYDQVSFSAYPPGQPSLYMEKEQDAEKQDYHSVDDQQQVLAPMENGKSLKSSLSEDRSIETEGQLQDSNQLLVGDEKPQVEILGQNNELQQPAVEEPLSMEIREQNDTESIDMPHDPEDLQDMQQIPVSEYQQPINDTVDPQESELLIEQQESGYTSEQQQTWDNSEQQQTVLFAEEHQLENVSHQLKTEITDVQQEVMEVEQRETGDVSQQQNLGDLSEHEEIQNLNVPQQIEDLDVQQQVGHSEGNQESEDPSRPPQSEYLIELQQIGDVESLPSSGHLGEQLHKMDLREQQQMQGIRGDFQSDNLKEEPQTNNFGVPQHVVVPLQTEVLGEHQVISLEPAEQLEETCESQPDEVPNKINEEHSIETSKNHELCEKQLEVCEEICDKTCEEQPETACEEQQYEMCEEQPDRPSEEQRDEMHEEQSDSILEVQPDEICEEQPDKMCDVQSREAGEQQQPEIYEEQSDEMCNEQAGNEAEEQSSTFELQAVGIMADETVELGDQQFSQISEQSSLEIYGGAEDLEEEPAVVSEDACENQPERINEQPPPEFSTQQSSDNSQPSLEPLDQQEGHVSQEQVLNPGQEESLVNLEEEGLDDENTSKYVTQDVREEDVVGSHGEQSLGQSSDQIKVDQDPEEALGDEAFVEAPNLAQVPSSDFVGVLSQDCSEIPLDSDSVKHSECSPEVQSHEQMLVLQSEEESECIAEEHPSEKVEIISEQQPSDENETIIPAAELIQISEITKHKTNIISENHPVDIDQQAHTSDLDSERKSVITKAVRSSGKENVLKTQPLMKELGSRQLRSSSKDANSQEIHGSQGPENEAKPSSSTKEKEKHSAEQPETGIEKIIKSSKGHSKDKSEVHNITHEILETPIDSDTMSKSEKQSKGSHDKSSTKHSSVQQKPTDNKGESEQHRITKKKKQKDLIQKRGGHSDQAKRLKSSLARTKGNKKVAFSSDVAASMDSALTKSQDNQDSNTAPTPPTTSDDNAALKSSLKPISKSIGEEEVSSDAVLEVSKEKISSGRHMHLRSNISPEKITIKTASSKMSLRSKASSEPAASKETDRYQPASDEGTLRKRGLDSQQGADVEKSEKKSVRGKPVNTNECMEKTSEPTHVPEEPTPSLSLASNSKDSDESANVSQEGSTSLGNVKEKSKINPNNSCKEKSTVPPKESNTPSQKVNAVQNTRDRNVDDVMSEENVSKEDAKLSTNTNISTSSEGVIEDETCASTNKSATRRGRRRTDQAEETQEPEVGSPLRKLKTCLKKALESPLPLRHSVRVSKSTEKAIASGLNLRHRSVENKHKDDVKVEEKAGESSSSISRRGKRKADAIDQQDQEAAPLRRRRGTRSSESAGAPENADGASSEGEDVQRGVKKGRGVKRKGPPIDQAPELKHYVKDEVQSSPELSPEITAKLSRMCRICGLEQDSLLNALGPEGKTLNLLSKIHNHLPIRILEPEPLPVGVCHSCVVTLIACESLVEKSTQVDKKLRKLYNLPEPRAQREERARREGRTQSEESMNEPPTLERETPAPVHRTPSSESVPVEAVNTVPPREKVHHTERRSTQNASTPKSVNRKGTSENILDKKTHPEILSSEAELAGKQPVDKDLESRPSASRTSAGKGSASKATSGKGTAGKSSTRKVSASKASSDKTVTPEGSSDKISAVEVVDSKALPDRPCATRLSDSSSSSGKKSSDKSCTDNQSSRGVVTDKCSPETQLEAIQLADGQPSEVSNVPAAENDTPSTEEANKPESSEERSDKVSVEEVPGKAVRTLPPPDNQAPMEIELSELDPTDNEVTERVPNISDSSTREDSSPATHPGPSKLSEPTTTDVSQTPIDSEGKKSECSTPELSKLITESTKSAEENDGNVSPSKRFGNTYGSRSKAGIWEKIEKEMEQLHDEPSTSTSTTEEFHIVDLELNVEDSVETSNPALTSPKSVVDSILGDWSGDEDETVDESGKVITMAKSSKGEMIIPDTLPSASDNKNVGSKRRKAAPCLFGGEEEDSDVKSVSQGKRKTSKGKNTAKEESFWPAPAPGEASTRTGESDPVDVSWKCSVCGSRGKSIAKFLEHKKSHQNDHKLINCTMCSESFTNLRLFTMHMKIHQGDDDEETGVEVEPVRELRKRPVPEGAPKVEVDPDYTPKSDGLYQCSECMNSFSEVESLREHKSIHAKDPMVFKCIVCRRTFFQRKEYREHLNSHQPGKQPPPMFQCAKCELKFSSQKEFVDHVTSLHAREKIRCEICSKDFENRNKLRSHNSAVHKGLNYKCHLCDKVYHKRISLVEHIRKHTGENPYACEVCDKRFNRLANYKAHMMIHENARRYECPYCGKRFNRQSIQQRHMKTHTSEPARTHRCRVCESLFLTVQEMHNHLKIHPRQDVERAVWMDEKQRMALTSFPCKVCKRVFGRVEDVINHMPEHTDDERDVAVKLKNPRLECDICGKVLFSKRTYKTHRNSHIDGKAFTCKICGKGYATSTGLNYHVLSHTGERPHQCSYCTKGFKNATDLKIHMRSHTGDFPFKCRHCNKAFRSASSLMKHGDVHKEDRPHKCRFCSLSFKRESTKLNHERIHTNDRRYKCKVCSRPFIQKGACDAHEKLHFRNVGGTEVVIRKLESRDGDGMNVEIFEQGEHVEEEEILDEDEDDYIIYEDDDNDIDEDGDEEMEEEEEIDEEKPGKNLSDPLLANHVANVPGLSITPIGTTTESTVPGLSITPVSVTNDSAPSSADSSVHITVL